MICHFEGLTSTYITQMKCLKVCEFWLLSNFVLRSSLESNRIQGKEMKGVGEEGRGLGVGVGEERSEEGRSKQWKERRRDVHWLFKEEMEAWISHLYFKNWLWKGHESNSEKTRQNRDLKSTFIIWNDYTLWYSFISSLENTSSKDITTPQKTITMDTHQSLRWLRHMGTSHFCVGGSCHVRGHHCL